MGLSGLLTSPESFGHGREFTFSMMKRKFGDSLRSKTDVSMVNETLCKVLCHNLVVLIHEMYELGIAPSFGNNRAGRYETQLSSRHALLCHEND